MAAPDTYVRLLEGNFLNHCVLSTTSASFKPMRETYPLSETLIFFNT
jgi:hypothetical protein